jgi:L-ascorbate metabolism protein UlaG (beta-lactamase superfamily)
MYLSHACFELKDSKTILIDPFFEGNEYAPSYNGNPDAVLVTHEHFDHCDAQRFDAPVICPPHCAGTYARSSPLRIGEKTEIEGIPIEMVSASHHQSQYPTGYIVKMEGKRIYHMGDTYLDGVKSHGTVDIVLIPIGGHYTMNIEEALEALRIINPTVSIPMHYSTFPQIEADPHQFKTLAEEEGFSVKVLHFGQATII